MNTPKETSRYWKRVSTTVNYDGFSEWYRATGCCRKFFWTIIMLGTVAPVAYYTYKLTTQYLQRPSATYMVEEQLLSIVFPDITICHTARFNRTYIKENINVDMVRMMASGFPAYGTNDEMLDGFIQWLTSTAFQPLTMGVPMATASEWIYQFYFNKSKSPTANFQLTTFVKEAALQCPQFLVKCAFGAKQFNCCDNAQTVWNEYATCYKIKPGGADVDDQASQSLPGTTGGLKVWAQVDRTIVPVGGFDIDVGMRVHVTTGPVTPTDNPVFIPPNKHALIKIDSTEFSFDPAIDKCTQDPPKLLYGVPYSQGTCTTECIQNISVSRCQCRTMGFGIEVTEDEVCHPLSMAQCVNPLTTGMHGDDNDIRFVVDQMNCIYSNCTKPCRQKVYDTYVSYQDVVRGPPMAYPYVLETPVQNSSDLYVFTAFFGEIKSTRVQSAPLWDFNTFICNLGGLLGLWTGLSIITLVQAVIYCYYVPCCYEGDKNPTFLAPDMHEVAKRAKKA